MSIIPVPNGEAGVRWLYHLLIVLVTCIFAFLWWAPLGFFMALLWTAEYVWDFMIVDRIAPEKNLTPEQEMQMQFQKWMSAQVDDTKTLRAEVAKLRQEIKKVRE